MAYQLPAAAPSAADSASVRPEDLEGGDFENPCLRLFLVNRETSPQRLHDCLAAAWAHDPLTALKLICHLRAVRGSGKGDREGFYTAALWMHKHHPRTLAANVSAFAEFGYIKDLPEILYRLIHGPDAREVAKVKSEAKGFTPETIRLAGLKRPRSDDGPGPAGPSKRSSKPGAVSPIQTEAEEPVDHATSTESVAAPAPDGAPKRKKRSAAVVLHLGHLARTKNHEDEDFRVLFNSVADFFAQKLRFDINNLTQGNLSEIGLAAKWCPSERSRFNQGTLLLEAIALRMFPKESSTDSNSLDEDQYLNRVLGRLRREVLVPLRNALQIPEKYMSEQRWSELPYERVPVVAMRRYRHLFEKHDGARFDQYLQNVKAGTAAGASKPKTAAPTLLPHEIAQLVKPRSTRKDGIRQWKNMVSDLRNKGLMTNCLAVCDLSHQDTNLQLIAMSLALLVSELSEDPWFNWVHSFTQSSAPNLLPGRPGELSRRLKFINQIQCHTKFSLRSIFDWILRQAELTGMTTPDNMVKTIFVFTSKELEDALVTPCQITCIQDLEAPVPRPWKDEYKIIRDRFKSMGLQDALPQVVFWNLLGPRSAAFTYTEYNIMQLSGYSDEFMRLFLEKGGVVDPEDEMYASIAGDDYDKLEVID